MNSSDPPIFLCPLCRSPLGVEGHALRCAHDGFLSDPPDGIHDLMTAEERRDHEAFVREYSAMRRSEGRGSDDPDYYHNLPYVKLPGALNEEWRARAASMEWLWEYLTHSLQGDVETRWTPLSILDAGAGNCWLTRYLAEWGHRAVALDVNVDSYDGLAAGRHYLEHYPITFDRVRGTIERLPFAAGSFDAVLFNGSLHYAADPAVALAEAARTLRPEGAIIIIDSPFYSSVAAGERMLRSRGGNARSRYLTFDAIRESGAALGMRVELHRPESGPLKILRRRFTSIRLRREIASMPRVVLRRGTARGEASA